MICDKTAALWGGGGCSLVFKDHFFQKFLVDTTHQVITNNNTYCRKDKGQLQTENFFSSLCSEPIQVHSKINAGRHSISVDLLNPMWICYPYHFGIALLA